MTVYNVFTSSFYSSITNSNGVATFSLTGLTSSATWTCSYNNVTDTCTVNVVTYYFIDDCSVDNTSNYTSVQLVSSGNGNAIFTYNSSEQAYVGRLQSSKKTILQFGDLVLHNNMKVSCDIKLCGSSWQHNGLIGFTDGSYYAFMGYAQGQKYYRLMEMYNDSEIQTTPNNTWSNLSTGDYNHHEMIYQDGVVTYTITNPSNVSKTLTLTLRNNNYVGGAVGLFLDSVGTANQCYIKNIIAEPI